MGGGCSRGAVTATARTLVTKPYTPALVFFSVVTKPYSPALVFLSVYGWRL